MNKLTLYNCSNNGGLYKHRFYYFDKDNENRWTNRIKYREQISANLYYKDYTI